MKKNFKRIDRCVFLMFLAVGFALPGLFAQGEIQIPGIFKGNIGTGKSFNLQVQKEGKYELEIKNPDRKIGKDNIVTGLDYKNELKMMILNSDGKVVGHNYYEESGRLKDAPGNDGSEYLDRFSFSIQATGSYSLNIEPLRERAMNKNFVAKIRFKSSLSPKILGMELIQFLYMVGGFVLSLGMIFFYTFIIRPVKNAKTQAMMQQNSETGTNQNQGDMAAENVTEVAAEKVESATQSVSETSNDAFCGKCGSPREADADFCGKCGKGF